jgi:hypothetical protein
MRLSAVGRLVAGGPWFGYRLGADGPRLVFGDSTEAGDVREPTARDAGLRRRDVALVAIAHFEEAAPAPPPELEATQRDLAEAVSWLIAGEAEGGRRRRLEEARDAIDDGLPGEVVSGLLREVFGESRETLELLRGRYSTLG